MSEKVCERCGITTKYLTRSLCGECYLYLWRKKELSQYPIKEKRPSYPCYQCGEVKLKGNGLCKKCYQRKYREENVEKTREYQFRYRKKAHSDGVNLPYSENKKCSSYLGVHVAERILSKIFKDVSVMPYGTSGYDFICNRGMKIDVKSSCITKEKTWRFNSKKNSVADFFLCLAFDNRVDLTPMYIWLIPCVDVSEKLALIMNPKHLYKWDKYKMPIDKIVTCCDNLKGD